MLLLTEPERGEGRKRRVKAGKDVELFSQLHGHRLNIIKRIN
jgi:hypothetical protein